MDLSVENFDQSTEVNNQIAQYYNLIIDIFNKVLKRNPSDEELQKWTDELLEETMTIE